MINRISPTENGRLTKTYSTSTDQCDIPPLSAADEAALLNIAQRQEALRNLTLGCIQSNHTGAHVHGPAGIGKSFGVLKTLREMNADFRVHQRITAKPLFLAMQAAPNAVHLIEDCEQLFSEMAARTLLRSALGGENINGRRERRVSYSVTGPHPRVMSFYFSGAVIFTSNRPLASEKPEVAAVLSRIPSMHYCPSDNEVRALMRRIAREGWTSQTGQRMSPAECCEVIEFVIQLAAEREARLDLRWSDHACAHFATAEMGGGRVDWRDMVKFHLMEALTFFDHSPATNHDEERRLAIEISQRPGLSRNEQIDQFTASTRLSRATFYRLIQNPDDV